MINSINYPEHIGLVTDNQQGRLKISLTGSGCSACHKSLCMLGDSKAKEIEIRVSKHELKIGDEVLVKINPSSGYKAVAFLYLLPFLLMLGSLIFFLDIGYSEGISGLTSLAMLIPYFGILYGFRNRLGSECKIQVVKK
jgi:positive regulator of sigma E activity